MKARISNHIISTIAANLLVAAVRWSTTLQGEYSWTQDHNLRFPGPPAVFPTLRSSPKTSLDHWPFKPSESGPYLIRTWWPSSCIVLALFGVIWSSSPTAPVNPLGKSPRFCTVATWWFKEYLHDGCMCTDSEVSVKSWRHFWMYTWVCVSEPFAGSLGWKYCLIGAAKMHIWFQRTIVCKFLCKRWVSIGWISALRYQQLLSTKIVYQRLAA